MKKVKPYRHLFIAAGVTILFAGLGCSKSTSTTTATIGDWSRASDFEGVARTEAVTFTISDTAYIGSGFDGNNRLSDYWSFDHTTGTWTQKADLPGAARSSAAAFAVAGNGYVGTGYDGVNRLQDFYQYDPSENSWTKKADFPAEARYDATGFAITNKGYLTCGFDGNYLKDLWEYDPSANQWTQKASLGGTKRSAATAFVFGDSAFVCGGLNNGTYPDDFWMYNQTTNSWTQKRKLSNASTDTYDDLYTDIARSNAVGFVMNSKAYLVTGEKNGVLASAWEYDPVADQWVTKTGLEASARSGAVAFTTGGTGYITTGSNSTYRFDDNWKFDPTIAAIANN